MLNQINVKSNKLAEYRIKLFFHWNKENSSFLLSFVEENQYESIFILTDKIVAKKHLSPFLKIFKNKTISVNYFSIQSGEENKNIKICSTIYKKMIDLNLNRKTLFINLGGGIISDIGGFVASTYKRGIDFINIPTSLLAMVDASVGGKVGVDFYKNKNAIGLFVNPKLIFINIAYLKTLPKREMSNGWGEVIKYGFIKDKSFFNLIFKKNLFRFNDQELMEIIEKSCKIKYFYVKDDELDKGKRQLLNFGHTVGHALEAYFINSSTNLKHGEAVLWGILIESCVSNLSGVLSNKEYLLIKKEIQQLGLVKINFDDLDFKKFSSFLMNDKKNKDNKIIFNLIKEIGDVEYGQILDLLKLKQAFKTLSI